MVRPSRFAVLTVVLFFGAGGIHAERKSDLPPGGPSKNNSKIIELFKPIVAKAATSTVSVRIEGKQVALGVIVDADGYILTKDSELRSDALSVKFRDGKELPARKIASNDLWDLAMLKVDAHKLVPVAWSTSKVAPVGNWVVTSAPSDTPVAIGVVSVASRSMPPGPKIALPTNNNNRGYLGIQMEPSDSGGVKIVVVAPKSPAEKIGLKADDIILAIEGKNISDPETLSAAVGLRKPGDKIKVRFRRGDDEDEVEVQLDKRPANLGFDRGDLQNSMGTERSQRRTGFPVTLQHDTILKATECGGPLVDVEGHVIGINIARGGRTDTYAIPAESVIPLISDLMAGKSTASVRPAISVADRIKALEFILKEAEAEKSAAEKKINGAKAALEKLQKDLKKENEKKAP